MSSGSEQITPRKCAETIYVSEGNCQHCGSNIRSSVWPLVAVVFGLLLAGVPVLNLGDLLADGVLGLLVAATGGYRYYEKRSRRGAASGQ